MVIHQYVSFANRLKFHERKKDNLSCVHRQISVIVLLSIILLLLNDINANAQQLYSKEDCIKRSGFEYGGMGGIYIASNSTADFYSGKPTNENNVDYILNNSYWYEEIRHLLDFYDTIFVREYPERMGYSPAFSFGLFVKYDFNCRTGIYAQFYYAKLRANDVVTIEVDPKEYLTEPDIRLCPIRGVEERNLLDLGITHSIGMNKTARLTLGAGINMNNTLVKESAIYIGEKKYNMMRVYGNRPYVPNSNQQQYEIRQGGIGFGVFGSVGARIEFSPVVAIEPGFTTHFITVNLKESAVFTPQMNFYLKIIFRDLLNFNE